MINKSPYPLFICSQILRGCLFASYMHRTIKEGGSVKAVGKEIGRLHNVAKP